MQGLRSELRVPHKKNLKLPLTFLKITLFSNKLIRNVNDSPAIDKYACVIKKQLDDEIQNTMKQIRTDTLTSIV